MKKYLLFMLVSYIVAFLFELNANLFFDGKLFESQNWPIFFLIWYGLIYSITFLLFHKKSLGFPVITWIVMGPIVELLIFHRLNLIVDPIIYAIMFFIPFWIYHKFIVKINEK